MGSTQVIPSFPASVWDGTSPSRPSVTSDSPPTVSDYSRLVSEIQAMQQYLLGQKPSVALISLAPDNYGDAPVGEAVQIAFDGTPLKAIAAVGALNGDTTFEFRVEQSESQNGTFTTLTDSSAIIAANTTRIMSFTPTKPWVRVFGLEPGQDADGNAIGLIVKGPLPATLACTIRPSSYDTDTNGVAVDFGAITGRDILSLVAIGGITGDSTFTVTYEESTNNTDWFVIPNSDASVLNASATLVQRFKRTRRYVRAVLDVGGTDHSGKCAILLGEL